MPPDSSADFDVHLERSLRDLKDLREDLSTDVFLFYDKRDVPSFDEEHKRVSPRKVYADLQEKGYKWYILVHLERYRDNEVANKRRLPEIELFLLQLVS